MGKRLPTSLATVSALVVLAWPGVSEPVAAPTAANARAELFECKRGKQSDDRRAVFRGEMNQIAGANAMLMRFHLHAKVGSEAWRGVRAPGVEQPRQARPGVLRFAYRQSVLNLRKGASYRASVDFRWYAANGTLVKREVHDSPVCRQPGKLSNPKIRDSIHVADGPTPDTRRYVVRVGNTGSIATQNIFLKLSVDGAEVDTRRILRLAPGQRREIGFVGPVCRGSVVARLDPDDLIPEIWERDNVMKTPCAELAPR